MVHCLQEKGHSTFTGEAAYPRPLTTRTQDIIPVLTWSLQAAGSGPAWGVRTSSAQVFSASAGPSTNSLWAVKFAQIVLQVLLTLI